MLAVGVAELALQRGVDPVDPLLQFSCGVRAGYLLGLVNSATGRLAGGRRTPDDAPYNPPVLTEDLALWMLTADTGDWGESSMRALAAQQQWEWTSGAHGPVLRTGDPGGEAALSPVTRYANPYVTVESYLALSVPIAKGGADAFRLVGDRLVAVLGQAPLMGSYGTLGPFFGSTPGWGAPFLRWRGAANSVELRAGTTGPELVLQPTAPIEDWFWRQGHGEAHAIDGFFGHSNHQANNGLGIPGRWYAQDWDVFAVGLQRLLSTLPAEAHALAITPSLRIYGRIPGSGAPTLYDITTENVELWADTDFDAHGHGWPEPDWSLPIGEATAAHMIATARALGIGSPRDLVLGSEGASIEDYRVEFYGLGIANG
jgi:hypothetical protein